MGAEPMWRRYLRLLRADPDGDVDDEIRLHLELLERELIAEGLSPQAARAEARLRFGDPSRVRRDITAVDRSSIRRMRRSEALGELWSDVRYTARTLRRQPGFTTAVIVTLALGIGATTAMFSAVDAALLRSLPFARARELFELDGIHVPFAPNGVPQPSTYPDFNSVVGMHDVFTHVASYAAGGLNLSGESEPERVHVGVVTTDFFATLGASPLAGRSFSDDEGRPGGPAVAMLAEGLWRRRFAGASVLGRSILLNDRSYLIVGIMPRGFSFPEHADLWIPMTVPSTFATFEPFRGYIPEHVIARLAPGVQPSAAAARLRALWNQSARGRENTAALTYPLNALQLQLLGPDGEKPLLILLGATVLLLLIACANVTHLLLAHASIRENEIAMRRCLGASRARIVRQLLIESLLLSLSGAAAGIALAFVALGTIRSLLPPVLSDVAPAAVDLRVLGFATLVAMLTGLGFGVWPALGASRPDGSSLVRSGGAPASARGAGRLRRALVTAELAIALTLLAGAGLMLRSFQAMLGTDPGFRPEHVGTLELSFGARGLEPPARQAVVSRALEQLAAAPGVTAAGATSNLPLVVGSFAITVDPVGAAPGPSDDRPMAMLLFATDGYFRALGIPLLRGRLMNAGDVASAPHVAVINATMAHKLWPGQDPIGKRFLDAFSHVTSSPSAARIDSSAFRTVVGVVADVRHAGLEDDDRWPQMYFPVAEQPPMNISLVARSALATRALLAEMREALREADPGQAVYHVRTMDDVLAASRAPRRLNTTLMTAFGALALLLAAVGVYGVVGYGVTRRSREFGIRAALGARAADLVRLAARESLAIALVGIALGLAGGFAFSRVIRSLLYAVQPADPATFIIAPILLGALVIVATLIPARRAARLSPMDVIRAE